MDPTQVAEACSAAADVAVSVARVCGPAAAASVRPHAEAVARALRTIRDGGSACQRRYREAEEADGGNAAGSNDEDEDGSEGGGEQGAGAAGAGGDAAGEERDDDADEDDEEAWAASAAAAAEDEAEGMEEADLISTAEEALQALEKAFAPPTTP